MTEGPTKIRGWVSVHALAFLLLVAAFAGEDVLREAYAHGVRQGYRFYSYGDAMVIL